MCAHPGDELIARLSEQLSADDDIVIAILFGSAARGDLRANSDLDVAVLTHQPLSSQRRRELIELLADISGRPIDLVDLRTSGISVTKAVLTDGRHLLCRDRSAYARLISRMLVDTADFLPYRQRILRERRTSWIG